MKPTLLAFNAPSANWLDGLPVGNGTIAAIITGAVPHERIGLAHEQLWRANRVAGPNPPFAAGELALYLDTGTLHGYHRELDLEQGLVTVTHAAGGHRIKREILVHAEADILALRVIAAGNDAFSGNLTLTANAPTDTLVEQLADEAEAGAATIGLTAQLPEQICYAIQALVIAPNGLLQAVDAQLHFDRCNELIVLLSMHVSEHVREAEQRAAEQVARILATYDGRRDLLWDKLRSDHHLSWRKFSQASTLQLKRQGPSAPILHDLTLARDGNLRPELANLLYNLGTYLIIAGNQRAALPGTAVGKWPLPDTPVPPYDQAAALPCGYWPVHLCGLASQQEPLLQHIERLMPLAHRRARDLHQRRGIAYPRHTDAWGRADADDASAHTTFMLLQQAWESWRYSGDTDRLRDRVYPLYKQAAAWYEDYLPTLRSELDDTLAGYPLADSPASLLAASLTLQRATRAAKHLDLDTELRACWQHLSAQLPPLPTVMRRHRAQLAPRDLAAVFPGPDTFADSHQEDAWHAAAGDLVERVAREITDDDPLTLAWLACCHARLGHGDALHHCLTRLAAECLGTNLLARRDATHELAANSLITTAMATALVGTWNERIHVLPALPAAWASGRVADLRLPGGLRITLTWDEGYPLQAILQTQHPSRCKLAIEHWQVPELRLGSKRLQTTTEDDCTLAFDLPASARCTLTWHY